MVKHVETIVTLSDDLGSAGEAQTIAFSVEGRDYEIDLNKRNRETFLRHMERWTSAGRDVSTEKQDRAQARQWAIDAGLLSANSRGRLSNALLEQWKGSH